MQVNKLLMLTANFPFENFGDSNFIKNEIEELCNNFDQVKILSTAESNKINLYLDNKITEKRCVCIKKFRLGKALKAMLMCFSKQARKEYEYAKQNYLNIGGLEIYKKMFKYYYAYNCLTDAIAEMSDEDTYIYSYWLSSRAFSAVKTVLGGKCKAKKIVSRAHRFDVYKSAGYQPFRSYLLQNIDEIYFVSDEGKTDFEKEIASNVQNVKSRFSVYRLGVKEFTPAIPNLRSEGRIFKIVSCSNVIQVKRLDLIVKALSLLNFDIEWTHYGDGPEMEHIKKLAEDVLSENKFVKFTFAGKIGNAELMEKYKTEYIDLFVNTSDSEGIPVSIMEAQQFGIPAIARNVGGNSEIILEELLLPSDVTPEIIANLIKTYAQQQRAYIEKIRNKCKEKVQLEYNAVVNTRKFCKQLLAEEGQHAEC